MAHGEFIWADLSSYRPDVTRPFYSQIFEWSFDDYAALVSKRPTSGLYQMPQKFIDMGMPSFWMSYIAVDDVSRTVEIAKEYGGKVEVGPTEFEGGGEYALIRDPLGAGFTVYNGTALDGAATGANARAGHALFVSDADAVKPFYSALFGWSFETLQRDSFKIQNSGETIAHLHQIEDPEIRGKEQYWAVLFGVDNLSTTGAIINAIGGEVIADIDLPEGSSLVARDPDGATFFLIQDAHVAKSTPPLKAYLGLALILSGVFLGDAIIWAIFLAIWVVMALRDRETWLFEIVTRRRHPILYWTILGLYSFFVTFTVYEVINAL